MKIVKKNLLTKLLISLVLYFGLLLFAIVSLKVVGLWDMEDAALVVVMFGVVGYACVFGGCQISFFLPFVPFVVVYGLIFIAVHFLYRRGFFGKYRKKLIIGYAVFVLIFGSVPVYEAIQDANKNREHAQQELESNALYWNKYGSNEKIDVPHRFIYEWGNEIKITNIDGSSERILKDLSQEFDIFATYISPQGTYFLDHEKEVFTVDTFDSVMDVAVLKDAREHQQTPKTCTWSFDERFLACQYRHEVRDENQNTTEIQTLVLFDIQTKQHVVLYEKEPYVEVEPSEGPYKAIYEYMAWGDDSNTLYFDMDTKVYRLDNIHAMSQSGFTIKPNIQELTNLHPCHKIAYLQQTIYCSVKAGDIGKSIEDPEHPLVKGKEYFVIAQDIDQQSPESYRVLNKAPLAYAYVLTPLTNRYITADFTVINTETGAFLKKHGMAGLWSDERNRPVRYWGE